MSFFGWLTKEKPAPIRSKDPEVAAVPELTFAQKKDQIIQDYYKSIQDRQAELQIQLDTWKKEQESKPKFKCVLVTSDEELETDAFAPKGDLLVYDGYRDFYRGHYDRDELESLRRQYNPYHASVYLSLQTSEELATNWANGQQDIANRHLTMGYFCPKTKQMIPHKEIKKIKLVQVSEG
jgi:hypothetical protein